VEHRAIACTSRTIVYIRVHRAKVWFKTADGNIAMFFSLVIEMTAIVGLQSSQYDGEWNQPQNFTFNVPESSAASFDSFYLRLDFGRGSVDIWIILCTSREDIILPDWYNFRVGVPLEHINEFALATGEITVTAIYKDGWLWDK
jgi:hypothetical protein